MPKLVDRDERRSAIAKAVLRVVAREGVRGVTIRRAAEEAGWSIGVINHYFADKQALLVATLREATEGVGVRMDETQALKRGLDRIRALLEAGMPLDDERTATCRIFFYFWAEGVVDPAFNAELARYYAWWRDEVKAAIELAQAQGRFVAQNPGELAETLVAVAEGLGVQGMFDPAKMTPERLRRRLAAAIERLAEAQVERSPHAKPARLRRT